MNDKVKNKFNAKFMRSTVNLFVFHKAAPKENTRGLLSKITIYKVFFLIIWNVKYKEILIFFLSNTWSLISLLSYERT